jgi:hypothetical protein
MVKGLIHAYSEGVTELLSRGTPPEVAAQNMVTKLLRDHPELAARMVEKLLPGFYALEKAIEDQGKKETLSERDVAMLDNRLYPVIVAHLENRLSVEETKLDWCLDAFEKFRRSGVLEGFGAGVLEDLDEPPIDLKETTSFSETGLNPNKLAGSALRRATIRVLVSKMESAQKAIEEVRSLATDLSDSASRKAGVLRSTADRGTYQKIDALVARLQKVRSLEKVGDEDLAGLTPRGSLEIAAEEEVVNNIREQMGVVKLEDSNEDPMVREARVAKQFEVLADVAKNFWSWEKIRGNHPHADALSKDYRQQAEFRVIPATEDTPAPSYGIEFKIVHRDTGQEVVAFRYSLARTFSENQSPEAIRTFFQNHMRNRGLFYVSQLYVDRAKRALDRRSELNVRRPTKPIVLGTNKTPARIEELFTNDVKRNSAYNHYQQLRRTLRSLEAQLGEASAGAENEWVDDAEVSEEGKFKRRAVASYKEICTNAEGFVAPDLGAGMSRRQLEEISQSLGQMRGYKLTFDFDKKKMQIVRKGIIGTGIGGKMIEVETTEFKRTYEDKRGDLNSTLTTLLAKKSRST